MKSSKLDLAMQLLLKRMGTTWLNPIVTFEKSFMAWVWGTQRREPERVPSRYPE